MNKSTISIVPPEEETTLTVVDQKTGKELFSENIIYLHNLWGEVYNEIGGSIGGTELYEAYAERLQKKYALKQALNHTTVHLILEEVIGKMEALKKTHSPSSNSTSSESAPSAEQGKS